MFKKFLIFIFTIFYFSTSYSNEVNKIQINGNDRIGEETIILYCDIDLNKKINEQEVNRILKNLYQTNFFEDVKISFDNDPDNEFDCFKWVSYWDPLNVIISFKEKKPIIVGLGYDFQVLKEDFAESHDLKYDIVITQTRIHSYS